MPRSVQNFEQEPIKNRLFTAGTLEHCPELFPACGDMRSVCFVLQRPGHLAVDSLGYDPGNPTYPNESE